MAGCRTRWNEGGSEQMLRESFHGERCGCVYVRDRQVHNGRCFEGRSSGRVCQRDPGDNAQQAKTQCARGNDPQKIHIIFCMDFWRCDFLSHLEALEPRCFHFCHLAIPLTTINANGM